MRKIYISLLIAIVASLFIQNTYGCSFDGGNIKNSLDNCFLDTKVVSPPWDLEASPVGGFNKFLLLWIDAISWVLAVAAVGAIVYGSFMLVISTGEDEKITKWKDIIKWWIIGFIGIITANTLIELIINILYDI